MQQSFQDDLFYKHCESGYRKSRIARLNLCYLPNELVVVTDWYRGDGFANKAFSF